MAKRNRPEISAAISITRPGGGDEPRIEITIKIALGKTVTAEMTPEQFALAITGRTDVPVKLRLRNLELSPTKTKDKTL
ncbi:hypothetical protein D3C80_1045180 [compost metagenome]